MGTTSTPIITAVAFECPSGALLVSDPCYIDQDDVGSGWLRTGLNAKLFVRPGTWHAEIETSDEGSWGTRVARLVAYAVGHGGIQHERFERVETAGVDSGQMYIGDQSNFPLDYDKLLGAYGDDFNKKALAFGGGIVSSTGYGDGCYPISVARIGEDIVAVAVDFIGEEVDEDE